MTIEEQEYLRGYSDGWDDGAQAEKKMMEADLKDIIEYLEEHGQQPKANRLRAVLPRPINKEFLRRLFNNPTLTK